MTDRTDLCECGHLDGYHNLSGICTKCNCHMLKRKKLAGVVDILDHKVSALAKRAGYALANDAYPYNLEAVTALASLAFRMLTDFKVPVSHAISLARIMYSKETELECKHPRPLSWEGVDWCQDCGAVCVADAVDIPTGQWVLPGHDHNG